MRQSQTFTVEIPASLDKLIERRTSVIVNHYFKIDNLDIKAMVRSAYLQGVNDGCDVGEKLANREFGLNAS